MVVAGRMMHRTCLSILCLTLMAGCAGNLTVSDSIMFDEAIGHEIDGFRPVGGFSYSGTLMPGATRYGRSIQPDSLSGVFYFDLAPNMGYGYGLASRSFAAALSAQLFMVGLDATVSPFRDFFLTGTLTTARSFGVTCMERLNQTAAIGPFYRRDKFQGFIFEGHYDGSGDLGYFAESIGLKGSFVTSTSFSGAQVVNVGIGYNREIEGIFLALGTTFINFRW